MGYLEEKTKNKETFTHPCLSWLSTQILPPDRALQGEGVQERRQSIMRRKKAEGASRLEPRKAYMAGPSHTQAILIMAASNSHSTHREGGGEAG